MRAAIRRTYGSPDVLSVGVIETPTPNDHEVLVRVHATTVNRTDAANLLGKPFVVRFFTGLPNPKSPVPGTDFAGEVVEVGRRVTAFRVGDRVWGFNDTGLASQGEFLTIAADAAMNRIPDDVSFAQAAASAEGAHYAINFMKRARYVPGQQVFVYGGTGAIGSAAIQLLKAQGSSVTAACHGDHLDVVRALGAEEVVDYRDLDFQRFAGRFDLVFDAVGKSSFGACKGMLRGRGRYVSSELGPHAQNLYLPFFTRLTFGPRVDFPVPTGSKESINQMTALLAAGTFRPLIDHHYPLEQIRDAYEYVMTGNKLGNVILEMD